MELEEYGIGGGIEVLLEPRFVSAKEAAVIMIPHLKYLQVKAAQIKSTLGQDPVSGKESEDPSENKQYQHWYALQKELSGIRDTWKQLDDKKVDTNPVKLKLLQEGVVDFELLDQLIKHNIEGGDDNYPLIDAIDLMNILKEILN